MKHILLYGERRSGKSTLITEIAGKINAEIYGYMTRRLEDTREGFHPIYIHPAGEYMESVRQIEAEKPGSARGIKITGLRYDDGNLIAWCDGKRHEPNLKAFNELGVSYIREAFADPANTDKIIIMDEVGFLEGQAGLFRKTVLDAFESDIPVICGVKKYPECDFTNEILKLNNVHVLNLTADNRSVIRTQVINIIENEWNLRLNGVR